MADITAKVLMDAGLIGKVLDDISYKDWTFRLGQMGDGFFLQATFLAPDVHTGNVSRQYGRKWYLSPHMVEAEIVGTAWAAIQAAEIHEAREAFKYKGKAPYNSHIRMSTLLSIADDLEYRS